MRHSCGILEGFHVSTRLGSSSDLPGGPGGRGQGEGHLGYSARPAASATRTWKVLCRKRFVRRSLFLLIFRFFPCVRARWGSFPSRASVASQEKRLPRSEAIRHSKQEALTHSLLFEPSVFISPCALLSALASSQVARHQQEGRRKQSLKSRSHSLLLL